MESGTPPKEYIKLTQEILSSKKDIFETFPICIKKIIKEKIWKEVTDKSDKPFKSFEAFCTHPLWQGLGLETDELLNYLRKALGVKALVLGELEEMPVKGKETGKECIKDYIRSDNITSNVQKDTNLKSTRGTSPSYLTKRLKRDNPELFEKVKSGELTAHAAAIVAGIKKPMVQVRTDDINAAMAKLLRYYDLADIKKAVEASK